MLLSLENALLEFITAYIPDRPAMLLGLSGGPDSMALYHLLLSMRYPFEVAHIDHNWRKESALEAQFLHSLCREQNIVLHLKTLDPPQGKHNLEDRARQMRLAFFEDIVRQRNLYGIFLAHHADDLAETVLKRVFEGANLWKLKGLLPVHRMGQLPLLRPLLRVRKQQIMQWLHAQQLSYFTDPTNADPNFLRSRMRHTLLPTLSEIFGKQLTPSLIRLADYSTELAEFLQESSAPYKNRIERHAGYIRINFDPAPPQTPFLWKVAVREVFDTLNICLTQGALHTLLFHLKKPKARTQIRVGKYTVCVEGRVLTLLFTGQEKTSRSINK